MATQFAPVEISTIKQGDFLKECEQAFRRINEQMIIFVKEHEMNCQAVLSSKVTIRYDAKSQTFIIVTDIEEKMPKAPSKVTTAFIESDPRTGELCLFAPTSGTNSGNPRQAILCDNDGTAQSE